MQLLRRFLICFASEFMRLAKRNTDRTLPRPTVVNGIDLEQTLHMEGYDGNPKTDRHHPDAWTEWLHRSIFCTRSLGKHQRTISALDQVSGVIQRAANTSEILR